jgi:3-oxoadipate enol-lactonase
MQRGTNKPADSQPRQHPESNIWGSAVEADEALQILGYLRLGEGPRPVVFLHEWLGDHTNYGPIMPYLDQRRFTFIFADLRGYGLSKQLAGRYSVSEASTDVARLMKCLGFAYFDVVGHSMSGMIAQRLLLDTPGKVGCLVVITPVPAKGFKMTQLEKEKLISAISDDNAAKDMIATRTSARYDEAWLDRKLAMVRSACIPDAMRGYLDMFTETDFSEQIRGIQTPVLAFVGQHDIPFYREESVVENFRHNYPRFEIAISREAGHYPMLETPVLLASCIQRFLARWDCDWAEQPV